ncbi:MAG: acyl-CoA desaturase [Fimbriimonadaceae bacterium]|nr:acyl-CoA desaturase [Chitinophagales bacterium]
MTIILIFFIAHWYLSLFSQSFLTHRYASHGAFTMNKFWEKIFYIFAYITMGSTYMSPRTYAIMHRMHHAYTDTPLDPHSPNDSSNPFSMIWKTNKVYMSIFRNKMQVEERFTKNLPDWHWLDKLGHSRISRILWSFLYIAFYIIFSPSPWFYFLIPIHILMGPIHGVIINWFAHKHFYVNFKLNNKSMNLFPIDLIMLGEAYHNNHHKFASSSNFGVRWYEVDPVYLIIVFFNWLGIVRINKMALNTSHSL